MSAARPIALTCEHVSRVYAGQQGEISALEDVSFQVRASEFLVVVGPSGCGKSTLLKLIAGLLNPTAGTIRFQMENETDCPRTAMVFQEHGLFPWMTILDNVAFGLEMRGIARPARTAQTHTFLKQMGLDGFANAYPHELSVGMRQRAALARAFLTNPQCLLMDEPFSALDAQSKLVLQDELLRIWKAHRKTVIYVTHDIEEAVLLGDRVLLMSGRPGRVREEIPIPLERPRDLHDRDDPRVREITWHIWKAIESDVRRSLQLQA